MFSIVAAFLMCAIAVPAFAHGDEGSTAVRKAKKARANVDASCMQVAVGAREGAIVTSFSDFHEAIETALGERKSALSSAWGQSEMKDRRKAIVSAMKAWKEDHKAAFGDLRADRKAAWDTFKTAAKACGETVPTEESLGKDAAGELAL
jgi:predicted lipoprotein